MKLFMEKIAVLLGCCLWLLLWLAVNYGLMAVMNQSLIIGSF
ncbi:hypothetical protein [Arsukibacterium ikkense]|nr:hypothetical protein [Arsukibacterium ikkense]